MDLQASKPTAIVGHIADWNVAAVTAAASAVGQVVVGIAAAVVVTSTSVIAVASFATAVVAADSMPTIIRLASTAVTRIIENQVVTYFLII